VLWLLLTSLGVGVLIGAVSIGGILLIPALNLLGGLVIQKAMATALFTFIFTGAAGTWLFARRGSIDWKVAVPVCLGAAPFGFLGAWANSRFDGTALSLLLSSVIAFAGIYTLFGHNPARQAPFAQRPGIRQALLAGIGAVAGFGSGLTGVGGPALSVPIMVLFGFSPLVAIGASQVLQILASVSGTVGNLQYGSIDLRLAGVVTVFEILGVIVGVGIAHAVNPRSLRRFVGVLCVVAGTALTVRALASW
jgi:uncharacterized membrane protein YfcA